MPARAILFIALPLLILKGGRTGTVSRRGENSRGMDSLCGSRLGPRNLGGKGGAPPTGSLSKELTDTTRLRVNAFVNAGFQKCLGM